MPILIKTCLQDDVRQGRPPPCFRCSSVVSPSSVSCHLSLVTWCGGWGREGRQIPTPLWWATAGSCHTKPESKCWRRSWTSSRPSSLRRASWWGLTCFCCWCIQLNSLQSSSECMISVVCDISDKRCVFLFLFTVALFNLCGQGNSEFKYVEFLLYFIHFHYIWLQPGHPQLWGNSSSHPQNAIYLGCNISSNSFDHQLVPHALITNCQELFCIGIIND